MVSEASGQQDHKTNTKLFLKVFAALCFLTAISFVIANSPLMKSQGLAWAVMMLVSCAKAFLVISFFMHLKWERTWKYVLTIPASLMSLLLVIALIPDVGRRAEDYSDQRWLHATEPAQAKTNLSREDASATGDEPTSAEVSEPETH